MDGYLCGCNYSSLLLELKKAEYRFIWDLFFDEDFGYVRLKQQHHYCPECTDEEEIVLFFEKYKPCFLRKEKTTFEIRYYRRGLDSGESLEFVKIVIKTPSKDKHSIQISNNDPCFDLLLISHRDKDRISSKEMFVIIADYIKERNRRCAHEQGTGNLSFVKNEFSKVLNGIKKRKKKGS